VYPALKVNGVPTAIPGPATLQILRRPLFRVQFCWNIAYFGSTPASAMYVVTAVDGLEII
jgi:hypothetical protein